LKSKIVGLLFEKDSSGHLKIKDNLLRHFRYREEKGFQNLMKADFTKLQDNS